MLVQARLIELFLYDPLNGVFTRRVRCGRVAAGVAAGTVDPDGYVIVMIDGRNYRAHRLAYLYMLGVWPEHEIDHENRQRADNRWLNIRPATRKQNAENVSVRIDSTSGVRGVSWCSRTCKWRASIKHGYRQIWLGRHPTIEAATTARLRAEAVFFTHAERAP